MPWNGKIRILVKHTEGNTFGTRDTESYFCDDNHKEIIFKDINEAYAAVERFKEYYQYEKNKNKAWTKEEAVAPN